MAPQWTDRLLSLTIRSGSVYYLQDRRLSSPEPHFFVVLNTHPSSDTQLIFLIASSQVESVKRRRATLPPQTLVEVQPATDYPDFTLPTIIDCNQCFPVAKAVLLEKLQLNHAQEKAPLPAHIIRKLISGVLASPLITEEVKACLR